MASARQGRQVFKEHEKLMSYGGTYYYRMALPALELAKYPGFECLLSWRFEAAPDGHIRIMDIHSVWHDDCDVIVFQRWMHADGAETARRARAAGQIIVQDVDDQFWALPTTNMARQTTDAKTSAEFNRDHYRKMVGASSAIICSTPTLASVFAWANVPTFVCRNAVDVDRWPVKDPAVNGMIGWVGGIPWRGNDLPLLRNILGPFLEKYGLPFYHGGVSPDPRYPKAWEQLGLDTDKIAVAHAPIVPIAQYPRLWAPLNLAVIPLEDSTFNRAKSWLKGLEASACGIPFIASRLPEYELLGVGRLASTPGEWRAHLEALLDPAVRRAEGAVNRARAEELSISRQWPQWADALRAAVGTVTVSGAGAMTLDMTPPADVRFSFVRSAPAAKPVRVAVGITTFNRPQFFAKVASSVAKHLGDVVDRVYVHDDGSAVKHSGEYKRAFAKLPDAVIQADGVNRGVAASKNALLRAMLDDGAEWLFLLEDDIRILSPLAVTGYLQAAYGSGIDHLSFAHHGPANVGGPVEPPGGLVSFFPHAIGAWTLYSRTSLETCGLLDEHMMNAWEHVEHSLRLARAGFTTGPYHWADARFSEEWLCELPGSIEKSSIRPRSDWQGNISAGLEYWRREKPDTFELMFGPGTPLEGWAAQTLGVAA